MNDPWRRNAWLLALGLAAGAALAFLGPDGLVALAAQVYARLPVLSLGFREDLARQVRVLYGVLAGLDIVALLAYVVAGRRGADVAGWLLARPGGDGAFPSRRERFRDAAVAIGLAYSILLVPARVVRDVLREVELQGVPYDQRRLRVYGLHSVETDYGPIAAFQQASGGRGDVLIVSARRRFDFADVFVASYLFPQRVYAIGPAACDDEALAGLRRLYPRAAWVDWACADRRFAPERIAP